MERAEYATYAFFKLENYETMNKQITEEETGLNLYDIDGNIVVNEHESDSVTLGWAIHTFGMGITTTRSDLVAVNYLLSFL